MTQHTRWPSGCRDLSDAVGAGLLAGRAGAAPVAAPAVSALPVEANELS